MTPIDDGSLTININTDNELSLLRDIISKKDVEDLIERITKIKPLESIQKKATYSDFFTCIIIFLK